MKLNRKWTLQNTSQKNFNGSIDQLIIALLKNRGIEGKLEIKKFLGPSLNDVTSDSVGIEKKQLEKTLERINRAIGKKEKIVVFGDYDVDGITGTAILWETLYSMKADVIPYIPHRIDQGYGLSVRGIEGVLEKDKNIALIITVDNGIVAHDAVNFAKEKNIDVIITDHHTPTTKEKGDLPDAYSIVHTTGLCGAGVAWILSSQLLGKIDLMHLDLVSLATFAYLVPLV